MLAWNIPQEDWDKLTVKTSQLVPGTQRYELLRSDLPSQWALELVAREFGPGTYKIIAGAGPYRGLNTMVTVSTAYARAAGWEPAPAMPPATPSPLDLQASRTFMEATRGAVDPVNLAAMVQTAVDNALQRVQPKTEAVDPFTLIMRGFELANTMSAKSLEAAKGMLGVAPAAELTQRSWADVALELGPTLLGTLQQLVAQPQRPMPTQPPPPAQPQVPTLPNHQPETPAKLEAQPMYQPSLPPPPQEAVPLLKIMKQYAPMLRGHLDSPVTPDALAAQLAGLLGADLDPSVHAIADHVRTNGPGILAHADPYLATEKAAQVMVYWSDLLNAQEQEPGE